MKIISTDRGRSIHRSSEIKHNSLSPFPCSRERHQLKISVMFLFINVNMCPCQRFNQYFIRRQAQTRRRKKSISLYRD